MPECLSVLTELTTLHLFKNSIEALNDKVLCEYNRHVLPKRHVGFSLRFIASLKKLILLNLNGNLLTALPPSIGQLSSLHQLSLSSNAITSLLPEVSSLTQLTELYLDNNQLQR